MINNQSARFLALLSTVALVTTALAGCGNDESSDSPTSTSSATSTPSASSSNGDAAGSTASLKLANGREYTVNLAPGVSESIDIFGNDGGEPVNVWGGDGSAASGGLAITAAVGSPFAIEFPQSASTGYSWQPTGGTAPGTVAELVEDFVLSADQGPGSPGTHYFVYRATAAGTGTLEFSEFPPGSTVPSATPTVNVTVTK